MKRLLVVLALLSVVLYSCDVSDNDGFTDTANSYKPLGANFKPFAYTNGRANLVFYITADMSLMDTTVDSPTPSLTVDAVSYISCGLTVSNTDNGLTHTVTDTLLRYKGNTTFDKPKKQFRIKFTDNNEFYGYRRINLHSEWKDATLMREKLAYDFLHEAGVEAPRANHVRVYLNDTSGGAGFTYIGLYTMVEAVDKIFMKHHIAAITNVGNIYKMYYGKKGSAEGFADLKKLGSVSEYRGGNGFAKSWPNARAYRLKSNEDINMEDYSDLSALINAIDTGGTALSNVFNVTGFLNWLAANTLLGGWDNYFHNAQNYYLYNVENSGYWHWIAWDYDNSLGNQFSFTGIENEDIYYSSYSDLVLIHKVLAVPAYKTYYTNKLQALITSNFNVTAMNAQIDALKAIIQPYALADPLKQYSDSQWADNIEYTMIDTATVHEQTGWDTDPNHLGLKDYIAKRVAYIEGILGSGAGASDTVVKFTFDPATSPTTVGVRGNTLPLDWGTDHTMLDNGTQGDDTIGDGIFTVCVTFPSSVNGLIEFKFVNDGASWVPSSGTNLSFTVDNTQSTQLTILYTE